MSEDVASMLMVALTVIMTSTTLAAVIVVAMLGNKMMSNFIDKYNASVNDGYSETFLAMGDVQDVSATVAYKAILERLGEVETLSITYLDGVTTGDYKTLLVNAQMLVTMDVEETNRGTYLVTVTEVNQ